MQPEDTILTFVWVIYFGLVLYLSFLVGRWAESKGHSFWEAFLGCALLSLPLGYIVVACMPTKRP